MVIVKILKAWKYIVGGRKLRKKMVIISIILLALILTPYIKRKIFLYDLSKSVEVILYKDVNGNMVVWIEKK